MKELILEYIINEFDNDNLEKITYDTLLISSGYIDSFSMMGVLIFLENKFNVKIPEREVTPENFNSVQKMCNLVSKFKK